MRKVQQPAPLIQGIEGYIYRVSGNQMPMKGAGPGKPKGIVREIFIYRAVTLQQATGSIPLFGKINTRLIAQVKSDSTGHYQAALPAGKYSVMVKEGNRFFAAESDGQGILNPAEVISGKITSRNVTVNLGAVY